MLQIKVPPLGESIVEATVSKWHKKEGDAVAAGDTLVELDTDKITVEVPALKPGVLGKRAKNEGDVVKVDEVLGELDDSATAGSGTAGGGTAGGERGEGGGGTATKPQASAPTPVAARPAASAPAPAASQSENVKSSPAARRIADERGIDIAAVHGTGRGGVVSKPDVLAAGSGTQRAAASSAPSASRPAAPAISPPRGNGAHVLPTLGACEPGERAQHAERPPPFFTSRRRLRARATSPATVATPWSASSRAPGSSGDRSGSAGGSSGPSVF